MERNAFLASPKHQHCLSNEENMIVVPAAKKVEIVTSIQVCIISWMNFEYKENGGKNSFSYNSKASISCIQCGEYNFSDQSQKE